MEKLKSHSQRLHDLGTVLHDLEILVRLLRDGYRLEDEEGPKIIDQLDLARGLLKSEIDQLRVDWKL